MLTDDLRSNTVAGAELSGLTTHCRICPLCEAHCGTLVTIDRASRAITGVRGDPDDPFSRGYICAKAFAMKELHHDPDVLKMPLIKRNGRFEEATWNEALDFTADRLKAIQHKYGQDSVGFYIGNPTAHHPGLLLYSPLLLEALSTRQIYCAGSVDHITKVLSSLLMYGDCSVMTVPDIDRTELFVVHGGNPAVSNGSLMTAPGMPRRIKDVRKRGGRVIVIDPRRTETAELADLHVPIRPGTDAYFLFAVIQHLFASGRVELGRVGAFAKGLETVRLLAQEFTPQAVEGVCGVSAGLIRSIAEEFADAGSAVWYGRTGTCTQRFGTLCCWLQDLINILTGNLDRPGGAMFPVGIVPAVLYAEKMDRGVPPFARWHSRVRRLPELSGVLPTAAIADEILTPGAGQVRAFITMAGNPVLSHPNGGRLDEAFADLEFMVSMDIYLNETTRHADVILPSPSEATHSNFHFFYIPFMVRKVAKWNPALFPPQAGQLHDWEIFQGLVARLKGVTEAEVEDGLVASWTKRFLASGKNAKCADVDLATALAALGDVDGPDRLFDVLVRTGAYGDAFGLTPGGLSLASIAESPHGVDLGPMEPQLPGLLATPDCKVDLAPARIVADVPRLKESLANADPRGELLLVGRRQVRSNNSWMHNLNVLVKGKDRCTLMMNPNDADRLGLSAGQIAKVSTTVSSLEIPVAVTDEMMQGVVSIPHGWGHNLASTKLGIANKHCGANANSLIDEELFDAPSINSILNGIPVQVSRLDAAPPEAPR